MFLKELLIHNGKELIREISFKKGINLIVDEVVSTNKKATGNSVGKTTVLRLIDFCLNGDGKNIYVDPEFGVTNTKIETFLKDSPILITLILIRNFDDVISQEIIIRRNFRQNKNKILSINGEPIATKDFPNRLNELIFNTQTPSFNQLKSKNIRDEKDRLQNTIRVLPPNVTTGATYEHLHLFWFGIDVDDSKDKLIREQNIEERIQKRFRKDSTLSQINQSITIVQHEIEELDFKKLSFNLHEDFEQNINEINEIKSAINKWSTKLSRLELRKELIIESKLELQAGINTIDTEQIRKLYEKANSLIPNLQRTFEDTLLFHNNMIGQKIAYITEELPSLESEIKSVKRSIDALIQRDREISKSLNLSVSIDELQELIAQSNKLHEHKGRLEERKSLWEVSNRNLERINRRLNEINETIGSMDELIQKRIQEFNVHFASISKRLDGEHSLLSAECIDGVYKFTIGNIDGNPGTGGKKSQMASFDLAYIQFADELGIPCLHFILQDQIENVHANQISNLLIEIVDEVNCQYILPVLRDKLPRDIDVKDLEIVSLSQSDKLFKVD